MQAVHHYLKRCTVKCCRVPCSRYQSTSTHGYGYLTPTYEIMRPVPVMFPAFKGAKLNALSIGSSFIVGAFEGPRGPVLSSIGINSTLQLGSPSIVPKDFEVRVWPVEETIISLKCGRAHTLALTDTSKVFVWGSNNFGQCGVGDHVDVLPFSTLSTPGPVSAIAAGLDNTFVLTDEGEVLSCGWAADGQTGTGNTKMVHKLTRVNVPSRVAKISSSADTTLVLCADGKVYGWGNNEYNQISESDEMQCVSPIQVEISQPVSDIAAGGSFSLFVTDKGELWSCGYGPGTGRSDGDQALLKVETDLRFCSITASLDHAGGITTDNKLARWGRGQQHKLISNEEADMWYPHVLELEVYVVGVVCGVKKSGVLTNTPVRSCSVLGMIEDDEEDAEEVETSSVKPCEV